MSIDLEKIEQHIKAIADREGVLLYEFEVVGAGKGRTLRVYIDKDAEGGVSVDDCSNVSRALDLILDVEDLMGAEAFQLEVSSPGLERRLTQPWHFSKAEGKNVRIQMLDPMDSSDGRGAPRKKVTGVLGPLVDGKVEVVVSEGKPKSAKEALQIPLENIKKAQVVFDFNQGYHPKQ